MISRRWSFHLAASPHTFEQQAVKLGFEKTQSFDWLSSSVAAPSLHIAGLDEKGGECGRLLSQQRDEFKLTTTNLRPFYKALDADI